jgi:hypothetical protein
LAWGIAQEITEPALQPLAHQAKAATVLLKYVPVPLSMLPAVTSALQEAAAFNLWATRGAAVTFVQVGSFPTAPYGQVKFVKNLLIVTSLAVLVSEYTWVLPTS